MREIKFRAYQPHNSLHREPGIYEVDDLVFYGKETGGGGEAFLHVPDQESQSSEYFSDIRLMQYTGLKDKNGKEIYEGDIVSILYTDWPSQPESDTRTFDEYIESISHIGRIVFNPYYGWRVEDVGGIAHGEHGHIKVVGNIHENPELLEKKG